MFLRGYSADGVETPAGIKGTNIVSVFGTILVWEVLAINVIFRQTGAVSVEEASLVVLVGTVVCALLIYILHRSRQKSASSVARILRDEHEDGADLDKVRVLEEMSSPWGLSRAETEVALFAVKGFSNKEIADLRGSEVGTVKKQLSNVYRKSGLESRYQLMAYVTDEVVMGNALSAGPMSGSARQVAAA